MGSPSRDFVRLQISWRSRRSQHKTALKGILGRLIRCCERIKVVLRPFASSATPDGDEAVPSELNPYSHSAPKQSVTSARSWPGSGLRERLLSSDKRSE